MLASLKALSPPQSQPTKLPTMNDDRVSRFLGVQICSDLHLESIRPWPPVDLTAIVKPSARYLALVGDIGVLTHDAEKRYEFFLLEIGTLIPLLSGVM